MLVIRLRRIGRAHDPHYRIVVAEHTSPVQGKFIAEVGHYHPKSKEIGLKKEEFLSWVNKGAKPSNTVARLAIRSEIEHKHVKVKQDNGQPKKKAQERAAAKAEKAAAPAPVEAPTEVETSVEADAPEETEVTEAPSEEATSEEISTEETA